MIGLTRSNGSTLRIEFLHHHYPQGADLGKDSLTVYRTECRLFYDWSAQVAGGGWVATQGTQLAHGNSFCSIHERLRERQSMREEGRKRALHRALNEALREGHIAKYERDQLLASYFGRLRGKAARNMQTSTSPTTTSTNGAQTSHD